MPSAPPVMVFPAPPVNPGVLEHLESVHNPIARVVIVVACLAFGAWLIWTLWKT